MAGYRLYFMDRFTGHIVGAAPRVLRGRPTRQPWSIAESWGAGQPMEPWEGEHKLKRWEAKPLRPTDRCKAKKGPPLRQRERTPVTGPDRSVGSLRPNITIINANLTASFAGGERVRNGACTARAAG